MTTDQRRITVDSTLSMVTVFKDRAQLFHTASLSITPAVPQEEVTLVFEKGQWSEADRTTLQVNVSKGHKNIILRSVQFRSIQVEEDMRPQRLKLTETSKELEKQLRDVDDKISVQTKIVEANNMVVSKLTHNTPPEDASRVAVGQRSPLELFLFDPAAQDRMYTFLMNNIRALNKTIARLQEDKQELQRRLVDVKLKIAECGWDIRRTSRDIAEVQLVILDQTDLHLQLSYMVRNASWTPLYDLRVDSQKKVVGVTYNAMVRQSSSSDWERVRLELSTANPHFGGDPPTLSKWNISLTPPYVSPQLRNRALALDSMTNMMPQMMSQMMPVAAVRMSAPPPPPPAPKPAAVEAASVSSSTTSTTFSIAGLQTIRSDNTPVKVTIMQAELPVHLRYSAVPKLDEHTYLKAKATNTTGFVFLPGAVNTFADNQFIAKSEMGQVAVDEEFWTFLGVDDNLSCTRKLVHRKLIDKSGMFSGKRTRVEYKYAFTAKNTRKTAEELVVWDQFPISQDKKIVVNVIVPHKETTPTIRFETNDLNAIEWFWDMAPNSSETFEFVFHVDYPQEERVTGLELR